MQIHAQPEVKWLQHELLQKAYQAGYSSCLMLGVEHMSLTLHMSCMCVSVYVCVCVFVCMCMCVCACVVNSLKSQLYRDC